MGVSSFYKIGGRLQRCKLWSRGSIAGFVFLVAALLLPSKVFGSGPDLLILNDVTVYSEPGPKGVPLVLVRKGSVVQVVSDKIPGYQKIVVKTNKGSRVGYIKSRDLVAPSPRSEKRSGGSAGLEKAFSIAVHGGLNYQTQGGRSVTETDGTLLNLSTLSGSSTLFGLELQFPLTFLKHLAAKIYVQLQNVSISGTATVVPPVGVTSTGAQTILNEQFLNFGVTPIYYFSPQFWAGVGFQLNTGVKGSFTINGYNPQDLSSSQIPKFFGMYGVSGYDFKLGKSIYLVPQLRLGALFSTPLIYEGDFILGLAYKF